MLPSDIVAGLDEEYPPDHAALHHILHKQGNGIEAEIERDTEMPVVPRIDQAPTVLDGRRNGLLADNVLASREGRDNRVDGVAVRGRHQDGVETLALKELVEIRVRRACGVLKPVRGETKAHGIGITEGDQVLLAPDALQ